MTGELHISKKKNMEKHQPQKIYLSSKQISKIHLEEILINTMEINDPRKTRM